LTGSRDEGGEGHKEMPFDVGLPATGYAEGGVPCRSGMCRAACPMGWNDPVRQGGEGEDGV